jgi:hypothetical protein
MKANIDYFLNIQNNTIDNGSAGINALLKKYNELIYKIEKETNQETKFQLQQELKIIEKRHMIKYFNGLDRWDFINGTKIDHCFTTKPNYSLSPRYTPYKPFDQSFLPPNDYPDTTQE